MTFEIWLITYKNIDIYTYFEMPEYIQLEFWAEFARERSTEFINVMSS